MSYIKEIAKHGKNYMFAHLATKALGFISIPIYTRLLSVEEYGVYSVFIASVGIFTSLFTLSSETAISRYYYEKENDSDFKRFVGTNVNLSCAIFLVTGAFFLLFVKNISNNLNFNLVLTIAIIPLCFFEVLSSVFEQIYYPQLQSKKIALFSSIRVYLSFLFSIIAILCLASNKYFGQVIGGILTLLLLSFYLFQQIGKYYLFSFDKKHIKYILTYAVPQIPYFLSGVIIAQFGRIFISNINGFNDAGIYSFASSIAGLMVVFIGVSNQTWTPYYFQYMNECNYEKSDRDSLVLWKLSLVFALFLTAFGNEIGFLLAPQKYFPYLYLVPVFIIGYVFYQWSYVYFRNIGYAKKTYWNAIIVFVSGIVNILLNITFIPRFGSEFAAISFAISYVVMLFSSYMINRFYLKIHALSFFLMGRILFVFLCFWGLLFLFYSDYCILQMNYFVLLVSKILILIAAVFFLVRREITQLYVRYVVD